VGYVVFSAKFGRCRPDRSRQGIVEIKASETALVQKNAGTATADGYSLQVINLDKSLDTAMSFFANRGFLRAFEST